MGQVENRRTNCDHQAQEQAHQKFDQSATSLPLRLPTPVDAVATGWTHKAATNCNLCAVDKLSAGLPSQLMSTVQKLLVLQMMEAQALSPKL